MLDKSSDECRAALSHLRGNQSSQVLHVLTPLTVLSLFKKMLDEDCELLNLYDRPEKLIVTDIAIPPLAIRPSAFVDFGRSSNEDSLTSILRLIINTNSFLREELEGSGYLFKCWVRLILSKLFKNI
ncbi:DNA-directed RNA polymerase III subunit RPC1 protein [Dioscorea alata]|uniref:DNA-directed RNA polymerase III subunit RPC1 protein n=1 Tax=Dioscorea alata TaxID=55571 RepID=A0ACB7VL60_DIOAL|nr:DNA-directed RNA polymerase III subunit RPC1 protein [Dioscorea alata]